jgi:hypothetical protein
MSGKNRILEEINYNKKLVEEIQEEIKEVENELKIEDLSQEKKEELEEKIQNLETERIDIGFDIAILQEILDKYDDEETYCGYSCDGRCQICIKYTEGYDPFGEI